MRVERARQGAADSRFRGSGGVLERCEALVRFECLREVPSALRSNVIVVETAREGTDQPSAAANTFVSVTHGEEGRFAAHLTLVSDLLTLRASAMCFAPSAPPMFEPRTPPARL